MSQASGPIMPALLLAAALSVLSGPVEGQGLSSFEKGERFAFRVLRAAYVSDEARALQPAM